MSRSKNNLLESIIPFLVLGISVAILVALFVFLSYVLLWGLVIGGILWLVAFVKERLFPTKSKPKNAMDNSRHGRIIEHDDIK